MLYLVKGRAGTGKTKYLHEKFQTLSKETDKLLFIVPDNATFDTQNAFLNEVGPMASSKIKIMGFTSLSTYILDSCGKKNLAFADEGIKHVVMSMAIDACESELRLFSKKKNSKDMCELMLSTMKSFKHRQITCTSLRNVIDACDNEKLKQKLSETLFIFESFEDILSKSYIDPLDVLPKASLALSEFNLFDGYTIVIDSHKAFSKQQYYMIKMLLSQAKDMYVSIVTDDVHINKGEIFYTNYLMEKILVSIAKDVNSSVDDTTFVPNQTRFIYDDLKALEDCVFRFDGSKYDGKCDHIEKYVAKSIFEEADFVARTINKHIIEDDYRYKDIAIVSRHPEKYIGILDLAFDKYGISYFISRPEYIDSKPLVKCITSLFNIVIDNFDKDDIIALLKTGLVSFSEEDINLFENYVFVWDVNRKDFLNEFKNNPEGFSEKIDEEESKKLKRIENVRNTIVSSILKFKENSKNTTGKNIAIAFMNLLYDLEIDKNIKKLAKNIESDPKESKELYRLWNAFADVIDKLASVTEKYKLTVKRFYELLYTYISHTSISDIPTGIDQVTLYDVTTLSFNDKKIIFVIGCNDGEFPNSTYETGLFTDEECKELLELKLDIQDSTVEVYSSENMYVYVALTRASELLYMSYYQSEVNGENIVNSSIFTQLVDFMPNINVKTFEDTDVYDSLWCEKSAFEYLSEHYQTEDENTLGLLNYFQNIDEYNSTIKSIENNKNGKVLNLSNKEIIDKLFGKEMYLYPSNVDVFYNCRFKYFVQYALKIKPREKAEINSLEYGNLMHYLLEKFMRQHKNDDFSQLSEDVIKKDSDKLLDYYAENVLGGFEDKSAKFKYLYNRMKETAVKILIHTVNGLAKSKFIPSEFEMNINDDGDIPSYSIKIDDELSLKLIGKIDRVDKYTRNNVEYIRVVDYKTGNKTFKLDDILNGINLQTLIYMKSITELSDDDSKIEPAATVYLPAKNPVISAPSDDEEEIAKEYNKQMRMFGLVLDNSEIINAMEEGAQGVYVSISSNKDGYKGTAGTSLISANDYAKLFKKADSLLIDMVKELHNGIVEAKPLETSGLGPCSYCKYKFICEHDYDTDENRPYVSIGKNDLSAVLEGGDLNG